MKKSDRKLLAETLDKALEPPPKRKPALASHLADYDEGMPAPVALPGKVAPPDTTSRVVTPPDTTSRVVTPPDTTRPVSPQRDFNKRANSLDRLALPAGIFPGSSKKLYDALYIRTRGAIVPVKNIRATKRELSDWSGIRNAKTIDAHLRYFSAVGLIISTWERGQNDGALYEVLLPEETSGLFVRSRGVTPPNTMSPGDTPPDGELRQNSGSPYHQNSGSPHPTNPSVESTISGEPKTSFKTNTEQDDDEALAAFVSAIKKATKDVTGRELSPAEAGRWAELAEVLITELKIAAGRTTVSSVPAFLAEHLRRRLWKKEKRQIEAEDAEQKAGNSTKLDASQCPDCFGTGMWYPQGYEKGVAKCRHDKLKAPESTSGE